MSLPEEVEGKKVTPFYKRNGKGHEHKSNFFPCKLQLRWKIYEREDYCWRDEHLSVYTIANPPIIQGLK